VLRIVGLAATLGVAIYAGRIASRALNESADLGATSS
jgi:hypothetical protein